MLRQMTRDRLKLMNIKTHPSQESIPSAMSPDKSNSPQVPPTRPTLSLGSETNSTVAIAAGRRLADRLFGGPKFSTSKLDYTNIPSVVFAHPEIGSIGLTESQAREKYGSDNIKIYKSEFTAMYYAMLEKKGPTAYKLICAGPEERIVGMHIIGMGSAEILQGFGVAIKMGATKANFGTFRRCCPFVCCTFYSLSWGLCGCGLTLDSCVAIHPTSAEELVTMR